MRPSVVVETGVASWSVTSNLLAALRRNKRGTLQSACMAIMSTHNFAVFCWRGTSGAKFEDEALSRLIVARSATAISLFIARVVVLFSIISAIVANFRKIREARAILLVPDGGFGHTIMAPDWLRRLHPGTGNLIFFAAIRGDKRHNFLIPELWRPNSFVWTRKGIVLPLVGSVHDPVWLDKLYRTVWTFLRWYRPNTPCYCSVDDLLDATPRPVWLAADSPFNIRYEKCYYPLIEASPAPALHVSEKIRSRVSTALLNRFGSDFPKRCSFYVRGLATPQPFDFSSVNRLSAPLETYMPAINVLNAAGYQVLLSGDVQLQTTMNTKMPGGVIDWQSAGVDRHDFNLFAGTEVDLHIGSLSGGSAFTFITEIPALMLNAFAPGDGLPRSTVYYKWLIQDDGSMPTLEQLLGGMFYDHQLHGCRLVDNTAEEMAEAVDDFLHNYFNQSGPYGVNPIDLGIDAPWLRAANARLSPLWLERYRHLSSSTVGRSVEAQ
jgi:putative glycosyltransferase (TIGR04372 family)